MAQPFARAIAMFAVIAAAMEGTNQQAALAAIEPYRSRGKGGKRAHRVSGTARAKRMAVKASNVERHRRACK